MGRLMPLKALFQSVCGNTYYHWDAGTVPRAVSQPAEAMLYYLVLEITGQYRVLKQY